eukprot:CAMPEP_0172602672 /NCGR_PEP_ID=MMETSP1068-20121228/22854_1 /TAXON_ID=35684 /ORGANISM="Pseudopedinella elastica, Strain CCMP716" /LENGTH=49 /DNA_ID= /DNA_START= /DNA_END= /DNA_ORIENTATION=
MACPMAGKVRTGAHVERLHLEAAAADGAASPASPANGFDASASASASAA